MTLLNVQPGELITAEYINKLIDKINELEGQVALLSKVSGGGTQLVPSFFGSQLGDALALFQDPSLGLQQGPVLDAAGNVISQFTPEERVRRIIGQTPASGLFVPRGTRVSLLVAGGVAADDGDGTVPEIRITRLEGGGPDNEFFVGGRVTLVGLNFGTDREDLEATINDTVVPIESVNAFGTRVVVLIPESLPNAPGEGDPPLTATVTVRNRTLGTAPVESPEFRILPAPQEVPDITGLESSTGTVSDGTTPLDVQPDSVLRILGNNLIMDGWTTVVTYADRPDLPDASPLDGSSATALRIRVPDLSTETLLTLRVVLTPDEGGTAVESNSVRIFIDVD
jgi:hypothetical protein